jgi:hypothetical protein
VSGNGFAVADGVDAFVRLGLEMNMLDGDAERAGKSFAHFRKVRPQPGLFQYNDGVYMFDRKMLLVEQLARVLQKAQAVRALPFRIRVRKMCADVSKASRAEECVAERMRKYIAVGMPYGAFIKRELDPADNELLTFRETMKIVPNPAPHAHAF